MDELTFNLDVLGESPHHLLTLWWITQSKIAIANPAVMWDPVFQFLSWKSQYLPDGSGVQDWIKKKVFKSFIYILVFSLRNIPQFFLFLNSSNAEHTKYIHIKMFNSWFSPLSCLRAWRSQIKPFEQWPVKSLQINRICSCGNSCSRRQVNDQKWRLYWGGGRNYSEVLI